MKEYSSTARLTVALVGVAVFGLVVATGGGMVNLGLSDAQVAWFAAPGDDTSTVTANPASLTVDAVVEPVSAGSDGLFVVSARVYNPNTRPINETIALRVDADHDGKLETTLGKRDVSIDPDSRITIEYDVPVARLTPDQFSFGIGADTGDVYWATGTIELSPATFAVSDVGSATVVSGENASIAVSLTNVGDFDGSRTVRLAVDRNRDGRFNASEQLVTTEPELAAKTTMTTNLEFPTTEMAGGTYPVLVWTEHGSQRGEVVVLEPARFVIGNVSSNQSVVRGEPLTVSTTVTNVGDVSGSATISIIGPPGAATESRSVTLEAGQQTTVSLAIGTANLTRGSYTLELTTTDDSVSVPFEVRDGYFEIVSIQGASTRNSGEEIRFAAIVENNGDSRDTQTIELRLDLDGDDEPESYNITETLTLDSGEYSRIYLSVDDEGSELSASDERLIGTHIIGIYSEDTNMTDVISVRDDSDDATTTGVHRATLNEISQSKYGLDFNSLSGETRTQVREIYDRQPFANDLVLTEVLTREEIARERYDVETGPSTTFDFTALDVELQQQIEAEFDAQFESETGDRVESWEELAMARYGTSYEDLTSSQQEAVREAYWEQF